MAGEAVVVVTIAGVLVVEVLLVVALDVVEGDSLAVELVEVGVLLVVALASEVVRR